MVWSLKDVQSSLLGLGVDRPITLLRSFPHGPTANHRLIHRTNWNSELELAVTGPPTDRRSVSVAARPASCDAVHPISVVTGVL